MKHKIINIPIFGQALLVIFGERDYSVNVMVDNVHDMTKEEAESYFPTFHCNGLFKYSQKYDAYVLWMPTPPKTIREYGTLVHEAQHFVFTILDNLGFTHSGDSDELYSYLLAFVFEEIDCFIHEE